MTLARRYDALVAAGEIQRDAAQAEIVARLQGVLNRLGEAPAPLGFFGRLFGATPSAPLRGLYIWGDVGRGKTMLMDLFLAEAPPGVSARRVHFHAFMNDVHERIFRHRNAVKAGEARGDDPMPPVAGQLAAEARLLCFDEFAVTDIADAMILARLFTALFERGVVVVATSNVEPDRLYEGGLNRALFLPFVALLKHHMDVVRLAARTDYRLERLRAAGTYVLASGAAGREALDRAFAGLTGGAKGQKRILRVKGRRLVVPRAAQGVARMSFSELCEAPLAAADYLAIADAFHTLVLDEVPVMEESQRNAAKRFILLVDTLYDRGVKLVVSAAAEPGELFTATEGREAFEFQRTVSRLMEMRSEDYLARAHGGAPSRRGPGSNLVEG